jgi:hypothetical protein
MGCFEGLIMAVHYVLGSVIYSIVMWLLREVIIKFVILTAFYALIVVLVPVAISYLLPFISTSSLNSSFMGLSPEMWYFIDFFNLDFGLPLMISAFVARFLIRRLPVIG